jgi:hypothetical protein
MRRWPIELAYKRFNHKKLLIGDPLMKTTMYTLCLLISLLLITGCAKQQGAAGNEKGSPGGSKVEASLSINGKAEALKHIYTRRVEATPEGRDAEIEVLLSNQTLSEELLGKLLDDEGNRFLNSDDILKGTTIQALYLNIPKSQYSPGQKIEYDATLLTSKYVLRQSDSTKFTDFDLKKGVIKATASSGWEDTSFDEKLNDVKVKCSYSVDFQATLPAVAGQNADVEKTSAQIPVEGKAEGKMRFESETVTLKYAYAKRFKQFFDEPEEYITVILTDKAIPEATRLEILKNGGVSGGANRLRGIFLGINQFGNIYGGNVVFNSDSIMTNYFTPRQCTLENGRIKGNFKYDKEERKNKDDRDFAVAFEAPLTN